MALFSLSTSQLLLAFVSASILGKLTSHNFFLRWLASRKFTYFKPPQDNELRQLRDNPSGKKMSHSKSGKRAKKESHKQQEPEGLFKIALKDMGRIRLTEGYLKLEDLISLNYGTELEWVVGLALMSAFSYLITEFQFFIFPQTGDFNFSLLWAFLVTLSSAKLLWALTSFYFKYDESLGERTLCIAVGCVFLLVAMVVLTVDESRLEFGLYNTYKAAFYSPLVNETTTPQSHSRGHSKEVHVIILKLAIATVSAFFGAMFTFPGIRFGQLQRAILDDPATSKVTSILVVINYLSPLLVVLLWVKPLTKDLILNQQYIPMTESTFDTLRIYCIVLINLLKASLMTLYARKFLRSAAQRIVRLTRQPGFATNRDIKTLMASIPQYVHAVIIQYLIPTILCLFAAIMFKTLGGQQWIPYDLIGGAFSTPVITNTTGLKETVQSFETTTVPLASITSDIIPMSAQIAVSEIKALFSPTILRGLFGFATWWLHFAWFCTSSLGVAYHMYLV